MPDKAFRVAFCPHILVSSYVSNDGPHDARLLLAKFSPGCRAGSERRTEFAVLRGFQVNVEIAGVQQVRHHQEETDLKKQRDQIRINLPLRRQVEEEDVDHLD